MPPEAIGDSNSNCRRCIGIMRSWPHFVQGVIESGTKSPGMKTFAPHASQVTIFNGLLVEVGIVTDILKDDNIGLQPHKFRYQNPKKQQITGRSGASRKTSHAVVDAPGDRAKTVWRKWKLAVANFLAPRSLIT